MTELTPPAPEEVRQLRTDLGLTQTEFGQLLHGTLRTVQDWEAGKRGMPVPTWELALLKAGRLRLKVFAPRTR